MLINDRFCPLMGHDIYAIRAANSRSQMTMHSFIRRRPCTVDFANRAAPPLLPSFARHDFCAEFAFEVRRRRCFSPHASYFTIARPRTERRFDMPYDSAF